ncbi:TrkH-domain-containing protein [Clavulina sp. PMI_390]|nr:TrkH-domain-containing protein [Clavulina sp. PMI_390]
MVPVVSEKAGGTWRTEADLPGNALLRFIYREGNFYRIHLFFFTVVPLIASGIFYGANGKYPVAYVDALFLTYSSMTVTGLSTVNLSTTTPFQQSILLVLMLCGDITMVSLIVVLARKWYFRAHCEAVMRTQSLGLTRTMTRYFTRISGPFAARPFNAAIDAEGAQEIGSPSPIRNSFGPVAEFGVTGPTPRATLDNIDEAEATRGPDDLDARWVAQSPRQMGLEILPVPTTASHPVGITYAEAPADLRARRKRSNTHHTIPRPGYGRTLPAREKGLGGPPGPITLASAAVQKVLPEQYRIRLERTLTAPPPMRLMPTTTLDEDIPGGAKKVPYFGHTVVDVARNSNFNTDDLTDEQLEEVGGVEYRALRVLGYLVAGYFILTQVFSFLLIGPYLSTRYSEVFESQPRLVSRWWYSMFQVVGGYTGGGLSLVDTGMVPFQKAYIIILSLSFVILAGNHALVSFQHHRNATSLYSWIWTKMIRNDSPLMPTLQFLLDHPRRCFFYLFPSHQTWYLFIVLVIFSLIEWVSWMVLNIGLSVTESLPVGTRIIDGFFQGLAARASGISIVNVSALAPSVQFLYAVMMYIAIYPVAMSIRATNVYEEQSLGVYPEGPPDEDEEPDLSKVLSDKERLSKYLKWHMHSTHLHLLHVDIWWLVWGIFLVAIIERGKMMDPDLPWFDLFRLTFELVSAFSGIGLSLGTPNNNYSFSGECGPLSKVVIMVLMLRGRHRESPSHSDR